jgi:Uma2 family endonuclease
MGSVARLPRKWTYSDLERFPEDGPRYELYDGELWEMPAPTLNHQFCVGRCFRLLADYADRTDAVALASPLDIAFSEYEVVQPDVIFFSPARKHLINWDRPTRHAPDLVVEALSPGTQGNDRGRKLKMFARYGVPEYWLLDPRERTVEVRSLRDRDYALVLTARCGETFTSPRFPDLACEVSWLFRDC